MPVEDRSRLTSAYGYQAWRGYTHNGADFGGPSPGVSTKVFAAADGVVEIAWDSTVPRNSGRVIKVRHPNGSATIYVHTRNPRVKRGQKVRRGDWIAETWTEGIRPEAGIHLHLTYLTDSTNYWSDTDPLPFLEQYGWTVKDGRMCDEWEGRATKTPVTIQHAATVKPTPATTPANAPETSTEGELTMSDIKAIMDRLDAIEAKVDAKEGVELRETTAWRVKDGKQQATTASRVLQEIHGAAFESARAAGVSETILNGIVNRTTEQEA